MKPVVGTSWRQGRIGHWLGVAIAVLVGILGCSVLIYAATRPPVPPLTRITYETGQIVEMLDTSSETRLRTAVFVRLADKRMGQINAGAFVPYRIGDHVCLKVSSSEDREYFRLALERDEICDPESQTK